MKKITRFCFVLVIILLSAYILLNNYNKKIEDMSLKIGSKVGGGELSMNEYYTLSQDFELYKRYLENKEYKKAYSLLGASYRRYISFEEFEKKINSIDVSKLELENIGIVTPTTFDLILDYSGDEKHYSMIVDEQINRRKLYPDSFLDYKVIGKEKKSKRVKCLLKDYTVNIDKCIMNFNIENTNSEVINVKEAILYTNLEDVISVVNKDTIESKSSKDITFEFQTDYAFPRKIVLKCSKGEKDIELIFEINN